MILHSCQIHAVLPYVRGLHRMISLHGKIWFYARNVIFSKKCCMRHILEGLKRHVRGHAETCLLITFSSSGWRRKMQGNVCSMLLQGAPKALRALYGYTYQWSFMNPDDQGGSELLAGHGFWPGERAMPGTPLPAGRGTLLALVYETTGTERTRRMLSSSAWPWGMWRFFDVSLWDLLWFISK